MEVKLENIGYRYTSNSSSCVLGDISLLIEEGSFNFVVGKSGCGKTTLLKLIAGLLSPSKGSIKAGPFLISSNSKDIGKYRSKIGFLFQYPEHQLFQGTVYDDIAFGLRGFKCSKDMLMSKVIESLRLVGLSEGLLNYPIKYLTRGQKRLVALAGVLVRNPRILIMDEPTSGLDQKNKNIVSNLINTLKQEMKLTFIIASHDMDFYTSCGGNLTIISDGNVVISSDSGELFSNPGINFNNYGIDYPEITKMVQILNIKKDYKLPTTILSVNNLCNEIVSRTYPHE